MSIKSKLGTSSLLVGVALPMGVMVAVVAASWSRLPQRVATHWGPGLEPDGYTERGPGLLLLLLGVPLLVGLAVGLLPLVVPDTAPGRRALYAVPAAVTWFVTGVLLAGVLPQVDRPDGAGTRLSGPVLLAALVAAVVAGWLGHRLAPPDGVLPGRQGPPAAGAPRLADGRTPLVWVGHAPAGRLAGVAVLVVALTMVPVVVVALAAAPDGPAVPLLLAVVLPAAVLLVISLSTFRVTVGAQQIIARGGLGLPRLHVPMATVSTARTTTAGFGQWGGMGLRYRPGATGVITRTGPALELERTDGTRVVITVDDPEGAAATVNSLLERAGTR